MQKGQVSCFSSLPSTVIEGLHNTFAHVCFSLRAVCVLMDACALTGCDVNSKSLTDKEILFIRLTENRIEITTA